MYDYLIVGTGLAGATFAYHAKRAGMSVIVVDKRDHTGGNCHTYEQEGIHVHAYGPHIFHTSDRTTWEFVNRFTPFVPYVHRVKAMSGNNIYSMPINMMTLHQVLGVTTPAEAREALDDVRIPCTHPRNLEEWILSQVGRKLYDAVIYGYTKKQWGREPSTLPASIVRRLPIRMTWDDNYFDDTYQGIPTGGYARLFEGLLEGINVELGVDYFTERTRLEGASRRTVYTGTIDDFYDNVHGTLDYRTLRFDHNVLSVANHQGCSQMNYMSADVPYTRIVEHRHFDTSCMSDKTIVTRETPVVWSPGSTPYYPINDNANNARYELYRSLAVQEQRTVFCGRLATYKYRDMHQVVAEASFLAKREGLLA